MTIMKDKQQSRIPPREAEIRTRAYQIYESRGRQPGNDMDDWLQAEYELMELPIARIAEIKPARSAMRGVHASALIALVQAAFLVGTKAAAHAQR